MVPMYYLLHSAWPRLGPALSASRAGGPTDQRPGARGFRMCCWG